MDTAAQPARPARHARRPPLRVRARHLVSVVAIVAVSSCLPGIGGCTKAPTSEQTPAPVAVRPVEAMPIDIRRAQLPGTFPIEVPVADGRVQSASEQDEGGSGAWTYDLTSESTVDALAEWYARSYATANWSLAEQSGDALALKLVFAKGDAQSVIRLTRMDGGTKVQGTVGVGVPVADTF